MSNHYSGMANLTPEEKNSTLEGLLREKSEEVDTIVPLAYGQQGLWFLNELVSNNVPYNVMLVWRIRSRVNVAALHRAFQILTDRHPILRTTYLAQNGIPFQHIHARREVDFQEIDAKGWSLEVLDEHFYQEAHQPFHLEDDSPLRLRLFKQSEQEYFLSLTVHHIAIDGHSLQVLLEELGVCYASEVTGVAESLPPLAYQYADYVRWQADMLEGSRGEQLWAYWREKLSGELPILEIPVDHPRPAVNSYRGDSHAFQISADLTAKLKELAQNEETTLFSVLLTAFHILLQRYTGQTDSIVGSPTAARSRAEFTSIVGYFVDMVALRADLSGNPSFRTLLAQIRQTVLEAIEHQDFPFPLLVDRLRPARDLSRHPLVQVLFVLQMFHKADFERFVRNGTDFGASPFGVFSPDEVGTRLNLRGLYLESYPLKQHYARFDLELEMLEVNDALSAWFQYNTDLFEAETIKRWAEHYVHLLEKLVANPDVPIGQISLLTDAQWQQIIYAWNATRRPYPINSCVHTLVARRAAENPHALAVISGTQQLTYAQLDRRANQLAHVLRAAGVGPEICVAVCLEQSAELIVAFLGILKAGGVYVPLDPNYPLARLAWLLDETQPAVLLTQNVLKERLPMEQWQTLLLDEASVKALIEQQSEEAPVVDVTPDHLAYIIHTSGSTGQPKGSCIIHRSIVRLVVNTNYVNLGPSDCVAQVCNPSFDVSTFEIWGALLNGATLFMLTRDIALSSQHLNAVLRESGITTLFLNTALFNQLMIQEVPEAFQSLRYLLIGGEAADPRAVRELLAHVSPQNVLNGYGPTENTAFSTSHRIEHVTENTLTIPIGKPIANSDAYILDAYLQPVSVGIPGELYVGGDGLARGYLHRPDLTAERFVPHPFSTEPGARLYKTGDLACYQADGTIEFLGRIDHQVKLRGFRVEPGEIEAVLTQHPSIQECIVQVQHDKQGEKRLVAYFVPAQRSLMEQAVTNDLQKEHIEQWLRLYDETYSRETDAGQQRSDFNIVGWNSSYTGMPIPPAEMQEQVDQTVARLQALHARRILEVGCGSGLLLLRLASQCDEYWGTDFSGVVLKNLEVQIARQGLEHVFLHQLLADDFSGIPEHYFDLVVVNSTVQYFPGIDYLIRVLEGAVHMVRPGGVIFVGDVRSLPLLDTYYTSIQFYAAADALSGAQLQQQIQKGVSQEEELVIDPEFFSTAVEQHFPQIYATQIQWRRGHAHNELTRFRYDVLLHVGEMPVEDSPAQLRLAYPNQQLLTAVGAPGTYQLHDWQRDKLTVEAVRQLLQETQPTAFCLVQVPNARIWQDIRVQELLTREQRPETVRDIRTALADSAMEAIDPEEFWALSRDIPYVVAVRPSESGDRSCIDVLFRHRSTITSGEGANGTGTGHILETGTEWPGWTMSSQTTGRKLLYTYTNNPLQAKLSRTLIPQARQFLVERLPDYLVPSAFVALEAFPLTPNGKVDRRALPVPDSSRPELTRAFVAPRTPVEKVLAAIWSEILGIEQIGAFDNFFELGGHSLLITQINSRIRSTFRVDLPLRQSFEATTIAAVAKLLLTYEKIPGQVMKIARLYQKVEGMSSEEVKALLQAKKRGQVEK